MDQEFDCKAPKCKKKVRYDSSDSNNYSIGAFLKKRGNKGPSTVYLTCEDGHVHSYELTSDA